MGLSGAMQVLSGLWQLSKYKFAKEEYSFDFIAKSGIVKALKNQFWIKY